MEFCGASRLLRLYAGKFDHLGPLFGFVGDELTKISRRTCHLDPSLIFKLLLQFWIGEPGIDRLVEGVDDVGGRVSRR
jgi:hypothetical protein